MTIASLANALRVFRGGELDPAGKRELVKEVLLMTLARASKSDTNVVALEVSAVQKAIEQATGEKLSEAEIRVAASAELFENVPIETALSRIRNKLDAADRVFLVSKLAEVIRSDRRVSEFELDYFDRIAAALVLRPSEIAGLLAAD